MWNNSGIRINNQPIFYKTWLQNRINYVEDFRNITDYSFKAWEIFVENYKIDIDYLGYFSVLLATKAYYKRCKENKGRAQKERTIEKFIKVKKARNFVYSISIKKS